MTKNREMGGPLALDGRRLMGGHNNQPKDVVDGEGGVGEETRPGGTCGGRCPIVWGVEWSGKKIKIRRGLRRPPIDDLLCNNQPKTGFHDGGEVWRA